MINPSQIPDEVVEAAFDAYLKDPCIDKAFFGKAIAAAINAWPEAEVHNFDGWTHAEGLVLPLTQQASDE